MSNDGNSSKSGGNGQTSGTGYDKTNYGLGSLPDPLRCDPTQKPADWAQVEAGKWEYTITNHAPKKK